jgi:uncharacterized membrane protein YdjX (TVP38/TMEM64 family)
VARLVLAILGIGLLVFAGRHFAAELPTIPARIERLGFWGPAVFAAVYALATVAFVPGALLTLAAGAVFGLAVGVAVVLAGATAGASLAFLIARYAARGAVERLLKGNTRFAAIDRAVGRDGRRITFLLRLSPLFPFNLLNYALGLTTVRFADFLVASVGMLPGTLLYVYSGKVAGEVALAAGGAGPPRGPGYYGVLGLGLAATIGVTILITRTARRALREAVE